jgi:hypothetical protein
MSRHTCPQCGTSFAEAVLSEKPASHIDALCNKDRQQVETSPCVEKPFIAVGYIDHQGCARWEPGKDPSSLNPDQLLYVSHLPKPSERN